MLIYEYPNDVAGALMEHATQCGGGVECFAREHNGGAVMLCGNGKATGYARERKVELLFSGGNCGERGGEWLFWVGLWTPVEYRSEFVAWYQCEHMPMLLECPLWDGCRFVEQQVTEGCQFYALHQLASRAALDSEERQRSRATPWFKRLAKNEWFDGAFSRVLCRRI